MKIVLIVLAALALLLLCPIRLDFCWNKDAALTARWLFFKFGLLPQNKKKNAPKAEAEQTAAETISKANEEVNRLKAKYDAVKQEFEIYKTKIKTVVEAQLRTINELSE